MNTYNKDEALKLAASLRRWRETSAHAAADQLRAAVTEIDRYQLDVDAERNRANDRAIDVADLRKEVDAERSNTQCMRIERDSARRRSDYAERQRDDHRAVLNRFADRLRVVHEDPKIEEAVFSAITERDVALARVKELEAELLGIAQVQVSDEEGWPDHAARLLAIVARRP